MPLFHMLPEQKPRETSEGDAGIMHGLEDQERRIPETNGPGDGVNKRKGRKELYQALGVFREPSASPDPAGTPEYLAQRPGVVMIAYCAGRPLRLRPSFG